MDEKNIIQQGETVKYIITSRNPNFNIEEDDFYVELLYGRMSKKITIKKSDMLYGTGGEYLMQFSTKDMIGKVTARTVYYVKDADIDPNGEREEVDEQAIAFVVTTPCPILLNCPKCSNEGHDIHFERTEEPDIAALYMRLCVTEIITPESGGEPYPIYRPLITHNDEYIYVLREQADNLQAALNTITNNH